MHSGDKQTASIALPLCSNPFSHFLLESLIAQSLKNKLYIPKGGKKSFGGYLKK